MITFEVRNGKIISHVPLKDGLYAGSLVRKGNYQTHHQCIKYYFFLIHQYSDYTGYTVAESRIFLQKTMLPQLSVEHFVTAEQQQLESFSTKDLTLEGFIFLIDKLRIWLNDEFGLQV